MIANMIIMAPTSMITNMIIIGVRSLYRSRRTNPAITAGQRAKDASSGTDPTSNPRR
jgi:hypothetical protein